MLLRLAALTIGLAAVAGFAPVRAATADASAVMATVNQFIDGFNKGDTKSALATCASQTNIVDEFAPHVWSSCTSWAAAYDANAKQTGTTDGIVKLGTPWNVDVDGNVAYVVTPATYTFKVHGKPQGETGSVMTLVLKKSGSGWHITAWTWAKH